MLLKISTGLLQIQGDDPILPLQMNQARTIWKNPLKCVYDPILPLWRNHAKTIWKNSLKLQLALFCHCG